VIPSAENRVAELKKLWKRLRGKRYVLLKTAGKKS